MKYYKKLFELNYKEYKKKKVSKIHPEFPSEFSKIQRYFQQCLFPQIGAFNFDAIYTNLDYSEWYFADIDFSDGIHFSDFAIFYKQKKYFMKNDGREVNFKGWFFNLKNDKNSVDEILISKRADLFVVHPSDAVKRALNLKNKLFDLRKKFKKGE